MNFKGWSQGGGAFRRGNVGSGTKGSPKKGRVVTKGGVGDPTVAGGRSCRRR